jgi:hypothetical protein
MPLFNLAGGVCNKFVFIGLIEHAHRQNAPGGAPSFPQCFAD